MIKVIEALQTDLACYGTCAMQLIDTPDEFAVIRLTEVPTNNTYWI